MALFGDYDPQNLEDVLQKQAEQSVAGTKDQYTQARKRLVAQQAHSGRLMSGVADYPLADLANEEGGALSGISDQLAQALGAIPSEDYRNQRNFRRNYNLATDIAERSKPSTLDEIFGGIGSAGQLAAFAALA